MNTKACIAATANSNLTNKIKAVIGIMDNKNKIPELAIIVQKKVIPKVIEIWLVFVKLKGNIQLNLWLK